VNSIQPLDKSLLSGYLDALGKDVIQQMLDLYIQQSVTYIDDITRALKQESQSLWEDYCHKMKGATGSVGLLQVHAKLVAIEKSTACLEDKHVLLTDLIEVNERAIIAFKSWVESH
jgi:HPt (histidine-containing phosphotransfer) domain-containing protein